MPSMPPLIELDGAQADRLYRPDATSHQNRVIFGHITVRTSFDILATNNQISTTSSCSAVNSQQIGPPDVTWNVKMPFFLFIDWFFIISIDLFKKFELKWWNVDGLDWILSDSTEFSFVFRYILIYIQIVIKKMCLCVRSCCGDR